MMLTAFGEFYGCFLYFLTSWHTEFRDMRPEPLYWWFYFVILNTFWIVVPILICVHAWKKVRALLSQLGDGKRRHGPMLWFYNTPL